MAEKNSHSQLREHLQRTYGKGAVVSKKSLKDTLSRMKKPAARSKAAKNVLEKAVKKDSILAVTGDDLKKVREDLGDCMRCKLCKTRTHIVFGEGNPQAKLMFVGEGPGEQEDLQGRPFVGRAGQLLDKIIEAIGYQRSDVYIANVVKCRPPANRRPEPDEVASCEPFLFRQIEVIKPKVIVALGSTALQCLLHDDVKITQMRGKFVEYRGTKLMPTYHPAFLLRNPPAKKDVWEDMKVVLKELKKDGE